MLIKIKGFVKRNIDGIILFIGVILISLLSFAVGFIIAKYQEKEPIKFEKIYESRHCGGRNLRALFSSESFRERI